MLLLPHFCTRLTELSVQHNRERVQNSLERRRQGRRGGVQDPVGRCQETTWQCQDPRRKAAGGSGGRRGYCCIQSRPGEWVVCLSRYGVVSDLIATIQCRNHELQWFGLLRRVEADLYSDLPPHPSISPLLIPISTLTLLIIQYLPHK